MSLSISESNFGMSNMKASFWHDEFEIPRIWQRLSLRFLVMTKPAGKYLTYQERSMSLLMD
jgi:hypothetical protein